MGRNICLEGLGIQISLKFCQDSRSPSLDLKPGFSKYKGGMLTITPLPQLSVRGSKERRQLQRQEKKIGSRLTEQQISSETEVEFTSDLKNQWQGGDISN
jgi:hypothetical protein